jgi:hypothetical protein
MFLPILGLALAVNIGPISTDAPNREPQLAVNGSIVALAFGAGSGIYFSASTDSGKSFSPPARVAEADVIPLTRHRGPKLAISSEAIVITAVIGRTVAQGPHAHGLPSDGDLIAWRSTDGGKSWSKGVHVNDVAGAPTEGLHTLAAGANGHLFAAWLDKRSGHGTKLFGAQSTDGGMTWSKNVMIYESPEGTICECCHPSTVIDSEGQVLVMWRNWLDGSRDMYLAASHDGITFSKPEKLGTGTWKLNACPMDGGGLALVRGKIVSAWRRDHEIFLASPGSRETAIAEGVDVAVAGSPSGVYAIWSTPNGIQVLRPGKVAPITVGPKGAFPSIAAFPDGHAFVAWESDGKITVEAVEKEDP